MGLTSRSTINRYEISATQGISLQVTTAQISITGGGGLKQRFIACTLVILPLQTQLRNL